MPPDSPSHAGPAGAPQTGAVAAETVAEIIAAGSELLTPFRLDTNSLYLTAELNALGVVCRRKQVVGDRQEDLAGAMRAALGRADLVFVTGGLGPTDDDLTRPAAAAATGAKLAADAGLAEDLRRRFAARGWAMPERNLRQAERLDGADILPNPNGSAPGQWLAQSSAPRQDTKPRVLCLLPGPPRELRPMWTAQVAPRVKAWCAARGFAPVPLVARQLTVAGRPESGVDEVAAPIYGRYPEVETTILASSPGEIELHLRAPAPQSPRLEALLAELAAALAPAVFTTSGEALESVVGAGLRQRRQTLAVAESCTGGLLAGRVAAVPGASDYFPGGVVSYGNEVKARELGVRRETLEAFGAVSAECAAEMAAGLRRRWGVDWALAITGIAGPGGGSAEKPVGTVFIALAGPPSWRPEPEVRRCRLSGERDRIRRWSTTLALEVLRQALAAGP